MTYQNESQAYPAPVIDWGLRTYLVGVFNHMGIALLISAVVSAYIGLSPEIGAAIWGTPFKWVAIFAPLAFVFLFSYMAEGMSSSTARTMLYVVDDLVGNIIAEIKDGKRL